jgi:ribose 5-phosphate isomerase A
MNKDAEAIKKAVGHRAAELIQNGMLVGLGTGSTSIYFIEKLIERCHHGLKIHAIASSEKSHDLAKKGGIPLLDVNAVTHLDITVDGADEIDPQKRMIKGGGGALVREKIVASMSKELVIIVDESKLSEKLGKRPLPVEIIPFGIASTLRHLEKLGYQGKWRKKQDGAFFVTDNGNYIFDIHFNKPIANPEQEQDNLIQIPGVVDTGFFLNLAGRVIVGFSDGQITSI